MMLAAFDNWILYDAIPSSVDSSLISDSSIDKICASLDVSVDSWFGHIDPGSLLYGQPSWTRVAFRLEFKDNP